MTDLSIAGQLEQIANSDDFVESSSQLVSGWTAAGVGMEAVGPVLQFIEEHASIDFGSPGPLVHFAERFYRNGYEEKLLQSIGRKPTSLTVWMLNRILNGTKETTRRQELAAVMKSIAIHPLADDVTRQTASRFAERAR